MVDLSRICKNHKVKRLESADRLFMCSHMKITIIKMYGFQKLTSNIKSIKQKLAIFDLAAVLKMYGEAIKNTLYIQKLKSCVYMYVRIEFFYTSFAFFYEMQVI